MFHQEISEQDFAQSLVGTLNEVTSASVGHLSGSRLDGPAERSAPVNSGGHGPGPVSEARGEGRPNALSWEEKLANGCCVGCWGFPRFPTSSLQQILPRFQLL